MKNFVVSAGLAAIGVAGLQSALAANPASPQYWNVSATLRGFYDDNYTLTGTDKGSFGLEVLPSASFHMPLQQTDIGIRYTYGLYYYQDRQDKGVNAFDQTHQVDLWLDHAFNERWHGRFDDTFSMGQEPQLLNPNPLTPVATPYRINGDNISNHGNLSLKTDWTRLLSTSLTYNNNLYDYDNHGTYVTLSGGVPTLFTPGSGAFGGGSLAGILDRIEQSAALDLKWHLTQDTTAFVGYQFAWVNYIGNEPVAVIPRLLSPTGYFIYNSGDRDMCSHYGYLGVEHSFTANLSAMVRAGATYSDYYADPIFPTTAWTPYADLSISYTYLPGSYVQFGFTHDISATDQISPDNAGRITQSQETSVIYADINHRITSKLIATLIGRIQYSTFEGGRANSADETQYGVGLNLNYQINQHFSVDAGYNYDNLETSLSGYQYDRNRVYLGVTASY
jgi:hypothetical protein